jgi:hypothetical protein
LSFPAATRDDSHSGSWFALRTDIRDSRLKPALAAEVVALQAERDIHRYRCVEFPGTLGKSPSRLLRARHDLRIVEA